jgi:hypothetical protein
MNRLMKLSSVTTENENKPLNQVYPDHFKALAMANLWDGRDMPTFPELKEKHEEMKIKNTVNLKIKKRRERDRKRALYFKIGMSHFWHKEPISRILKWVQEQFPTLKWIRTNISYHRFSNLRELFQGDLKAKLNEGLILLDYKALPCNSIVNNKRGICAYYNGKCRTPIVVYKATWEKTNMTYVGNTQQHPKKKMQQHHNDVKDLVLKDKRSD